MSRKALGFDDSESEDEAEVVAPKIPGTHRDLIAESLKNQAKVKKYEESTPDIYQYDEVYDDIEAERESKKPKKQDNGGSKYIERLMEAKKQRNMDKLYVQDLKVQKERELEGDEFKDKESFVTSGYKEFREERMKEQENENMGNKSQGNFRESILKKNEPLKSSPNVSKPKRIITHELAKPQFVEEPVTKSRYLPKLTTDEIEQYRMRYFERKKTAII